MLGLHVESCRCHNVQISTVWPPLRDGNIMSPRGSNPVFINKSCCYFSFVVVSLVFLSNAQSFSSSSSSSPQLLLLGARTIINFSCSKQGKTIALGLPL